MYLEERFFKGMSLSILLPFLMCVLHFRLDYIDKDIWVTFHPLCELMLPVWDHCSWRDLILLLLCLFSGCGDWWALSSFFCWAEGLVAVKSWSFSYVAICRLNLPFPPLMMWLSFASISCLWWINWGCNLRSLSRGIFIAHVVFFCTGDTAGNESCAWKVWLSEPEAIS